MSEVWRELRCPACVSLGYSIPQLLFFFDGKSPPFDLYVFIKCRICKSKMTFNFKDLSFNVTVLGKHKKSKL